MVLQILPVSVGINAARDNAVAGGPIAGSFAASAVANAPPAHGVGGIRTPHVLGEAIGDFIRLAVAIGVLLFESAEHFGVLVQSGGQFLANRVQPSLVDNLDAVAGVLIQGLVAAQQAIDVATGSGGDFFPVNAQLLVSSHAVGSEGIDQILDSNQLLFVLQHLRVRQQGPEHVGHIAAGQHQRHTLGSGAGSQLHPLDGDAGFLRDVFPRGFLIVAGGGIQHVAFLGHADGDGLYHDGQAGNVGVVDDLAFGRGAGFAFGSRAIAAFRRAGSATGRGGRSAAAVAACQGANHEGQAQQES